MVELTTSCQPNGRSHSSPFQQVLWKYGIEGMDRPLKGGILCMGCSMYFIKRSSDSDPSNHLTMRAQERGTRSRPSDDDRVRWMWLADLALRHAPTEQVVAETEALARKEQAAIKRRIRRTAEQVKRQSKSKQ